MADMRYLSMFSGIEAASCAWLPLGWECAADIEGSRQYHRERHFKNHERNKAKMRAYARRRFFWNREMHLRSAGRATAAQLAALWKSQRGRCALTGRRLTRDNAHLDHIVPKARGGSDCIANLRWLCIEANMSKRAMHDDEFIAMCRDVMSFIGQRIQSVSEIAP